MKSNSALRVVESYASSTKDFTIQASGKMFHMVISGLYSNKPQSITREIWSNAFDAHAMVGKEKVPFEVTFPTSLNPTFRCRDFGPGIAHSDMEGFYTVLGHSTKEDTNKAVGKWGVGRMSPMSYTDTFSVISRHKGMVSYYSVQLGADGSPQLHVLAEPAPTDEPDGLEVSFPVQRFDIRAFAEAAELVSYGFDVPPNVTNSKEKQFSPIKKNFVGDNFYLYQDRRLSGAYAQMGCVLYPIPSQYLPRTMDIVYQFDIGDLEVTASRESLSFGPNDPTAANIKKMAEVVESELYKKLQDQIDSQPKLFDAAKLAPSLKSYLPYRSKDFTYKGQTIPIHWSLKNYLGKINLHCGYKGWRQTRAGWGSDFDLAVRDNYTIYVQDTSNKKGLGYLRADVRIWNDLPTSSHYLWIRADLLNKVQKDAVDSLIAELGYPVKYLKDLPDPGPRVRGAKRKVTVSILDHGCNGRLKFAMDDATFQKGGYYHPMSNNVYPSKYFSCAAFVRLKFGQPIYLVPKTLWKEFEGNSKWKLLEPALKDAIRKEADAARKAFGSNYQEWCMMNLKPLRGVEGPVGEFIKKVEAPRTSEYLGLKEGQWNAMFAFCGLPVIFDDTARREYEEIKKKYPLLALYANQHRMDFIEYIKLIDNKLAKGANG